MEEKNPGDRFILKDNRGMRALGFWLKERKYNAYSEGHTDKNGNLMIGLSWEYRPDEDWSKWEKRGLLVVVDPDYLSQAADMVKEFCQGGAP